MAPYVGEDEEDTQESTQEATQLASQDESQDELRRRSWGLLNPCSAHKHRAWLERASPVYKIGRSVHSNISLKGQKVSNNHCEIKWDGKDSKDAVFTVTDFSSNGTFINGEKIGKGNTRVLRNGNEIAFGSTTATDAEDDFRFMFRSFTGAPLVGVHAAYDLTHLLGQGSFANVHKAIHRAGAGVFAVKLIDLKKCRHSSGGGSDPAAHPFQREITLMESFAHPNVCKMREIFLEPDTLSIVLEFVEGGDLLDYILINDGLAETPARDIVVQICEALAYIHAKGITHRDLKPENILLTKDDPPIVKVADFGLAKLVDDQTMLRTMCGTPSYLAPEVVSQVDGSGYDNAVDSWSAGVIVFSMLTNTSPFEEDEGTQDIRARILTRQIAWASLDAHAPPFSPDARAFVRALLRTHPAQRLSLTAALRHPWLAGVEPAYVAALAPDDPARAQRAGSLAAITGAGWGLPSQADTESSTGVTNIPGAYPRRRALSLDGDGDSDMADANIGLKRRRAGAGGAGASPTKWRSPEQPPTDEERSEPAPRRSTRNRK